MPMIISNKLIKYPTLCCKRSHPASEKKSNCRGVTYLKLLICKIQGKWDLNDLLSARYFIKFKATGKKYTELITELFRLKYH